MDNASDFSNISREEKAKLLKKILENRSKKGGATVTKAQEFPLSVGQQGLWLLHQRFPNDTAHHVIAAQQLIGDVNKEHLSASLDVLADRHQMLKCHIEDDNGRPIWKLSQSKITLNIKNIDANDVSYIDELIHELSNIPFDLRNNVAWRAHLLLGPEQYKILLLTFHHIITDAWSIQVLQKELIQTYTNLCLGVPPQLAPVKFHYNQYVENENAFLASDEGREHKEFWTRKLHGHLPILDIPTDNTRGNSQRAGAAYPITISETIYRDVSRLAHSCRVTPFTILFAAYAIFLLRYSSHNEIVIGFPVAQRSNSDNANLVGYLVNMLAVRVSLNGDETFVQVIEQVNQDIRDAMAHGSYPFQKIVKDLDVAFDSHTTPVFQTVFNLMKGDNSSSEEIGKHREYNKASTNLTAVPLDIMQGTGQFDLMLELTDTKNRMDGFMKYDSHMFLQETIKRFVDNYLINLGSLIKSPSQEIKYCQIMPEEEKQLVTRQWCVASSHRSEDKDDTTIVGMFEQQCKLHGDKVALVHEDIELTYEEMELWVNFMASQLQEKGCKKNFLIGLYAEPGIEMIIAIMAIMKAGCAYVPLNPAQPTKRIEAIIQQANPALIIASTPLENIPFTTEINIIGVVKPKSQSDSCNKYFDPIKPEQLAYVLFTSGSTGIPKGVMVEHRNVVAFLKGFDLVAPHEPEPCGMMVTPFTFDASVWEIYGMLCFGGTLHIPPEEAHYDYDLFVDTIHRHKLTSIWVPPGFVNDIVRTVVRDAKPLSLKRVFVGAEPISQNTLKQLKSFQSNIIIINGYGPTETTVCASLFKFDDLYGYSDRTPIGRPLEGYRIDIVDENFNPVPISVAGEILISGVGVGRGYIQQNQSSDESFIKNPWYPELRCYRSGDLGRWLPDGNIEYIGRVDNQVKILGTRIEPDEVNVIIARQAGVLDSTVLVDKNISGAKQLIAFIVLDEDEDENESTDRTGRIDCINKGCRAELPRFMSPSRYIPVDKIYRNENGKVDSKTMLNAIDTLPPDEFIAAVTLTEKKLLDIWQAVLPATRIGITNDFFELGGDSLLALQLLAKIQTSFDTELSVDDLFNNTNIRDVAILIDRSGQYKSSSPIKSVAREAYLKG